MTRDNETTTTAREVQFPPEDEPLRADVSFLGAMLGEVLVVQGGQSLFDRVERSRRAAIRRRSGIDGAAGELGATLAGLDANTASEVVRAFSAYFSVVNMAERVHRLRRRREAQRTPDQPQAGSLAAVLLSLKERGIQLEQVRELLRELQVVPVFTAHPTRATRRTILAKEQRIARTLVDRIEHADATPSEAQAMAVRLRSEVELMWQTDEQPMVRPRVADEVEYGLFYLSEVVYRVVPAFYDALAEALVIAWGPGADRDLPCPLIRFGSWVGGDMDGNPNVGADTILATLQRQREVIINRYRREVREIFDHLSQSLSRVAVDPAVLDRCRAYRRLVPEVEIPERYHDMPYRVLLWLVWARLGATAHDAPARYAGADELADDLRLVLSSLRTRRGSHAGAALVERLLRRVETFGFHLATLDIRQDALVHRQVAGRLLGVEGFASLPPGDRADLLHRALDLSDAMDEPSDEQSRATLAAFRAIAEARRRFGAQAVGPYIISMCQGADDVLAVLLLARHAGLGTGDGLVDLDVAPLFETVDDLHAARSTLEALLADRHYRSHLRARDDEQLVMLGYSDSSKISGLAASRWALYRAQEELVASAEVAGIALTLFHGRGGTVSRGGSKPRQGILAEPRGAVRGHLRLTEQGEIVHAKYGLDGIAEHTLELMTGAVLEATALRRVTAAPQPEWTEAMKTVAEAGRAAYHALVHDDEDFDGYFREATPVDVIERLEIGSRPASRRSGRGVENLRAIPWVFAWMQSRHLLPGWYGVGAGLAAAVDRHGQGLLEDMAASWPFFANLLADVEMVLAKADMGIAAHYATLAGTTGERIFPRLEQSYRQTVELVTSLRGVDAPLDREPRLQRAIRLRNPYVDPISLLQVDLLRRWRFGNRRDQALERALVVTVRGIARGMQNTG